MPLLSRYPGAMKRHAKKEADGQKEVQKVLDSPDAPEELELGCHCKSLVLINGKARHIDEVLSELDLGSAHGTRHRSETSDDSEERRAAPKSMQRGASGHDLDGVN